MYIFLHTLQAHVAQSSVVADHCRTFALSDPRDKEFQSKCDHEHKMQCDRCNMFTTVINDIQANLLNVHCTAEQKEEMEYIITSCKISIEAWKAHLLRDVNQDIARQEVLESLGENSVLLVSDWAMKYIPRKFRESQRDWFGKRGISWHLSVAIRKCSNGEMQMLTFVHIFQSWSQESPAVLATLDDVLKCLTSVKEDVRTVYLKQDNAGCYHSAATMLLIQQVASKHRITLKSEVNKISQHSAEFIQIKTRKTKKSEGTVKSNIVSDTDVYDNSSDDDDVLNKERGEKLYYCPQEGCVKSFQRYHALEKHLDCERHKYAIEHETLYDKAMKSYATKLEHGACKLVEADEDDISVHSIENPENMLPMGWALKSTTNRGHFSEEQKKYLLQIFQMGEQTGKKADPAGVSKMMRRAKNVDGTRMFRKEDFLSARQIRGFFSRAAAKKKLEADFDDEDDMLLQQELFDTDLKEMKQKVIDEIVVQHPILFENCNICKMSSESKLSKLSVSMLQDICSNFQLDTSHIKGRFKKPYIQLLEEMVANCSCKY